MSRGARAAKKGPGKRIRVVADRAPASPVLFMEPQAEQEDDDIDVVERTVGRSSDVLPMLLSQLSIREQCRAGEVSTAWRSASDTALSEHRRALDLRRYGSTLTDDTLIRLLGHCQSLRSLNLSGCTLISDKGIEPVARSAPLLTDLNLACLPKLSADGIAAVAGALPGLTSLELGGCTGISAGQLALFGRWLELDEDEDGLAKVQG